MHTTTAQNLAHRNDPTWIKGGRSEYMRGDGVTIRKNRTTNAWDIYLPNGERPQSPNMFSETGFINMPAVGHSLTVAKYEAGKLTADAPVFVRMARR
jgi:hypothetical protein